MLGFFGFGLGGCAAAPDAASSSDDVTASKSGLQAEPALGVYVGNDPSDLAPFESFLGRKVDGFLGYTGNGNWADYDGSVGWATDTFGSLDRPVFWSVPLIPDDASLEEAASGAYNDHYIAAAQTLADFRPQDGKLNIRTGWEFNGGWFHWNGRGQPDNFKGAFRQFVKSFRSVSDRFVFEWNVNVGLDMDLEEAYPGDDVVDVVGMDFYWNSSEISDPEQAWENMVNQQWGLDWHQNFAARHNKSTSYSEWGVNSNDGAPYVEHAADWFRSHDVAFHTYWDSDFNFEGKISNGEHAGTGRAYKQAFGN
jgi:hypothetical protein